VTTPLLTLSFAHVSMNVTPVRWLCVIPSRLHGQPNSWARGRLARHVIRIPIVPQATSSSGAAAIALTRCGRASPSHLSSYYDIVYRRGSFWRPLATTIKRGTDARRYDSPSQQQLSIKYVLDHLALTTRS